MQTKRMATARAAQRASATARFGTSRRLEDSLALAADEETVSGRPVAARHPGHPRGAGESAQPARMPVAKHEAPSGQIVEPGDVVARDSTAARHQEAAAPRLGSEFTLREAS